jgi:oligopeptide transport system ATP-binding protein
MTHPLLSIRDLHTHFRTEDGVVKAVDGVSFDIEPGETLGIVGESGSGKSVTCLSMLRLVPSPPAFFPRGEVLFEGKDLLQASETELEKIRGDNIAMIFQDPMTSLNPYLSVERQLTEVLEIHRQMSRAEARHQSIEMLAKVGIPSPDKRIDQYPHEYSGGMRQRVMIAMALLCNPRLLIADEPTTALDVTIQAQILELIDELKRDLNMAVVLITHDLGVVAGTTDRLAVMYAGRIVEQGTTEEIFEDPKHPYTRGLLRSVPRLDQEENELTAIPGLPPDLSALPGGCPFHPRCELATDRCKTEYPEVVQFDSGRWSACWEVER